jgi:hypothetical protein
MPFEVESPSKCITMVNSSRATERRLNEYIQYSNSVDYVMNLVVHAVLVILWSKWYSKLRRKTQQHTRACHIILIGICVPVLSSIIYISSGMSTSHDFRSPFWLTYTYIWIRVRPKRNSRYISDLTQLYIAPQQLSV